MHYSENKDFIVFNAVENTLRKSIDEAAPHVRFHDRPCCRSIDDILHCGKHFE